MKRFHLSFSIVVPLVLAMSAPVAAGPEASETIEYTLHSCAVNSKESSRLIAVEHVKRTLAGVLAEKLEQDGRLKELGLSKDRARDLMTSLVQIETVEERWDGTGYTVAARAADGMDGILSRMLLVRKDRHVEEDLILACRRAGTVIQQIDDFSRGHRESVAERLEVDRYYQLLDELEALNGFRTGLILLAGGHFSEAAHVLTESIQRDPDGARLYHYRGVTHAKMGHQSEALMDYDRAIAFDRTFAPPHSGRAEILFAQGNRDEALAELRSAVAIDPGFTEAYFLMGIVYGDMGKNKRAIDNFTVAIGLAPDLAMAYAHRGNAFGKMGYHKLAFKDFNRALSLDGSLWIVHLAIDLDPKLAVAYFNRGLTHMTLGHVERAVADQRMAARLGWKAARNFLSAKGVKW